MKLAFLSGPRAGDEVEVEDEVLFGREKADIEIEDTGVSRQHARFKRTDAGLEVTDLESTNGTYVNGDRITGTRQLEPGDFVTLGSTTLEVRGDWRSAETEAIPVPTEQPGEEPQDYVPTSPITAPPRPGRPANLRPLLIGVGVVGLILVIGLWFAFRGGSDAFAKEVDEICRKAGANLSGTDIQGDNLSTLKPAARRLLNTRAKVREDLADVETDPEVAPRYGDFLQRYGDTNTALRRLSTLGRKVKSKQVRQAVDRVRSSAQKERAIANDLGLKVCGGLPI